LTECGDSDIFVATNVANFSELLDFDRWSRSVCNLFSQIELIGNSEDTCDVIKFELDGKMENGYIKSNKVYVKGKKVPKYQIK